MPMLIAMVFHFLLIFEACLCIQQKVGSQSQKEVV